MPVRFKNQDQHEYERSGVLHRQRQPLPNLRCDAALLQIHWLALLQLAVDRSARLLETVVSRPEWTKFKEEAAQFSKVRGSCLAYLKFRIPDSI